MLRIFALFIILFSSATLRAQIVLDNSSFIYKWNKIETDRFKILFPQSFSEKAPYYASLLDTLWTLESKSYPTAKIRKTTFIFRGENSSSNGFAALGPRRSEIYLNPPQDYKFLGNNDWLEKVLIHEFRHIVQYDQSRRGFSKWLYFLFGENTLSVISFASLPQWYWEGDAIVAETAFTSVGRGRISAFSRHFRANTTSDKKYSYSKQYLGSYKDLVPSHYVLGTYFVPFITSSSSDPLIWDKLTTKAFSKSFLPLIFTLSLKKQTGLTVRHQYDSMMNYLEQSWESEIGSYPIREGENYPIATDNKVYTDYSYPIKTSSGVIAHKSGLADIDQFVLIDENGNEKKLYTPGVLLNTGRLNFNNNILVWNEYRFDPRWRQRSYTIIKTLDISSGKTKVFGRKSRYTGAAISPDGKTLATVETTNAYDQYLVFISYENGEILNRFKVEENELYSSLTYCVNGNILVLRASNGLKTLSEVDPQNGSIVKNHIEGNSENIGAPIDSEDYISFSSDRGGIDNIYVYNKSTEIVSQLTEAGIGAFNPYIYEDSIYFNAQDVTGLLVKASSFKEDITDISDITYSSTNEKIYDKSLEAENATVVREIVNEKEYQVDSYKQISGLFNPHSWGPYTDYSLSELKVGVFSRDVLSTFSWNGGYSFDLFEGTSSWDFQLSYQGFYPIIDFNFNSGKRSASLLEDTFLFDWKENTFGTGLRLPLILTRSKYLTSLTVSSDLNITTVNSFQNNFGGNSRIIRRNGNTYFFRDYLNNGTLISNTSEITFRNFLKSSHRDFIPAWGQSLNISYTNSLVGDFNGGQFNVISRLYFPGIAKHHSFNGYWSYQKKIIAFENNDYFFRNEAPIPRGITGINTFLQFYTMGANYSFPLLYPDLRLGPVLYLKRLRSNFFFDYAYGKSIIPGENTIEQQSYKSAGVELRAEFHVFRFFPQITMGVRYIYDFSDPYSFELIFPQIDL